MSCKNVIGYIVIMANDTKKRVNKRGLASTPSCIDAHTVAMNNGRYGECNLSLAVIDVDRANRINAINRDLET